MLNFAIYGCGVISKTHATAIRALEGAQLIACASRTLDTAQTFAAEQGIRVEQDWNALIKCDDIDVICICMPTGTHKTLAIDAMNAGKHVVLEKPMALNTAECDEIIAAAERTGKKITIISQLRTSPDIVRAKQLLSENALGQLILCQLHMCYYREPSYYNIWWRGSKNMAGGGALTNQGVHGVDILRYLMGPVKQATSVVRTLLHDVEVEDAVAASLEFESGAIGVITASTATAPGYDREIKIYGTRGGMEFKEDKMVRLVLDGVEQPCAPFVSDGAATSNLLLDPIGHIRQLNAFVSACNGEDTIYPNQFDGKQAVELIEMIYRETI